jgi:GNAT superfamily N-acetyltransferase
MLDLKPPELLCESHDLSKFDCGKAPLNDFLRLHALDRQKAKLSRTYVVRHHETVVGYYTLAHISVESELAPKRVGRGMPRSIPAILMARFAVDKSMQGKGLGRSLFTDAIVRTWAVIQSGAAPVRVFVVDAKDVEAKGFYERFDMVAGESEPMRLYLSSKTTLSLFGP